MAIFTIGYGSRRFADSVSLLKEQHIAFIVDVRRFPRSTVLEYNRENLEVKLPQFGISYIFMGDILGGFRRGGYRKHTVVIARRSRSNLKRQHEQAPLTSGLLTND